MKFITMLFLLFFNHIVDAQVVVKRKEKKSSVPAPKVIIVTKPAPIKNKPKDESSIAKEQIVIQEEVLTYEDNIALLRIEKQIASNNFQEAFKLLETISLNGKTSEQYLSKFALCNEKLKEFDVAITNYKQLYLNTKKSEYLNKIAELEDLKESAKKEVERNLLETQQLQIAKDEAERLKKEKKVEIMKEIITNLISIDGGSFLMGSQKREADRLDNESQHQVTVSSFKISKYEVTFEQYDAFCEATGRQKPSDEGWGRDNRPVINVSWDDANAFAQWVGARLPTEAEWEYACRAGTTTPFNSGISLTQANFNSLKTMPVGSYVSNTWGLYDMHGNVWEWCSDWYDSYNEGNELNPQGATSGTSRVFRGGSWFGTTKSCRSAFRNYGEPSYRRSLLGFRLVAP